MTTKIIPDNLDNTKDFSSLVPELFAKANAAFVQANTSFAQANTANSAIASFSPITTYATASQLPLSGVNTGSMAFVTATNRLYLWNGSGWFNIALVNTSPTITGGANASYTFATNGTPIVLTLVGSDPEGVPLTWSYQVTSGSLGGTATISQSNNVFTLTPSTNIANGGAFGVTFTANDGINIATTTSSFTLAFIPDWTNSTQQAKLVASDAASSDYFGSSVAISGDTIVVGATGEDPSNITDAGSAYVFTRSGTTWTQQAKLVTSDAAASDFLGSEIAIDGDTIAVSGYQVGATDAGAAYVFTRSGTTWTQQAKLVASDAAASDNFGISVAINANTIIVGAQNEDPANITDAGSAYVFTRSGTTWTEQAKLIASDRNTSDRFGSAAAISGNTAVIGAFMADPMGLESGAAYVFTRSGTTWTQQAKLVASDAASDNYFGGSAAIEGDTIIVGAQSNLSGTGAAYVFTRSGTTWTQRKKLTASDGATSENFGLSVGISGSTAVSGAGNDNHSSLTFAGSAYVFKAP